MRKLPSTFTVALSLWLIAIAPSVTIAGDKGNTAGPTKPLDKKTADRARYIIKIGGCNDCHTTGYAGCPSQARQL